MSYHCKKFCIYTLSVTSVFYRLQTVFIVHLIYVLYELKNAKLIRLELKPNYSIIFYHYETFLSLHQVCNWRILAVTNGIYRKSNLPTLWTQNGKIKQIGVKI